MSFSRVLIGLALVLFGIIGVLGWMKKQNKDVKPLEAVTVSEKKETPLPKKKSEPVKEKKSESIKQVTAKEKAAVVIIPSKSPLGDIDRVNELFDVGSSKLSKLVETVTYKAKVSWLQGRAAWISDYATHYATSRHFIARSLNGKTDYLNQKVNEGDTFNVLRKDKDIKFYLVIDISCCKLFFYAHDATDNERTLLKTYNVGLGRLDPNKVSGCLTPLGKYTLGSKVVIYKPGSMGLFHNESIEMIRVFGTRWIPFDKEIEGCSERCKGYGIHGAPWVENKGNQLAENVDSIAKYESDGCIRLATPDMEELFAIIITKPTTVEIVKKFECATLPGNEIIPK